MSMPETLALFQVDAFSDRPFGGNPAAVCLLPGTATESWMQQVAAEMNLSETAFLYPLGESPETGYRLRWFTPTAEVDLCGHATLASAHVLWTEGYLPPHIPARFQTRSGLLMATLTETWITLDFPSQPVEEVVSPPLALLQSLADIQPVAVGKGALAEANYLVEVATEAEVRSLQPNFALMKTLPVMGVIVTAPAAAPAVDFVSRYFAPAVGIDEDPVTGSAHCSLAPYWHTKLGKTHFLATQVSARGGLLRVQLAGDRVLISGQAVTVLRGTLLLTSIPSDGV